MLISAAFLQLNLAKMCQKPEKEDSDKRLEWAALWFYLRQQYNEQTKCNSHLIKTKKFKAILSLTATPKSTPC